MTDSRDRVAGPAGLAEWLPLLGAICQALASFGDDMETPPAAAADRRRAGRPKVGRWRRSARTEAGRRAA